MKFKVGDNKKDSHLQGWRKKTLGNVEKGGEKHHGSELVTRLRI